MTSESDRAASRRTLLRRAAVTGGAAVAATAATAVNAAPASAAVGDPVLIGQPNAGGTTTVTSAAPGGAATLALKNATGVTLELKMADSHSLTPPAGSLTAYANGLNVSNGNGGYTSFTTANATMLVPIPPTRVLDTRTAAGRARLLEGAGQIDSQGRAVAGAWLLVHLAGIVEYGDGLIGNVTVAKTEKGGFATVYGRGDAPGASTINWWGAGQLLSNGVITQVSAWSTADGEYYPDTVAIWVQKSATAVILDVTGLLVFHPESAVINNPKGLTAGSGTSGVRADVIKASAERADREVQPSA
ncbi:hypothetical protein GA0074696_1992 [Micromonospora purpureochromogenes]|uniref:Uncharacterized protein n=1 Tax=Micromonospora purpureochromogenes TaxID=47872 RepID=A0A1C4WMR1_9ACTN|nr:hypothetical protein [Micromonospora purpureochromogenes]SCE97510.1 hypothetical protein GA0074696_1992 [Micromonospora purpureochromogenes]